MASKGQASGKIVMIRILYMQFLSCCVVSLMPHSVRSPAKDDLPDSSSGSLASWDVNSIPTASTPCADEDAEVGSQRGTH